MRPRSFIVAIAVLLASCDGEASCEDPPLYASQPGMFVCENIVEECEDKCGLDGEILCTLETQPAFAACANGVIERENLQGIEEDTPQEARRAAESVITVGLTCGYHLGGFPVFCYGCRD